MDKLVITLNPRKLFVYPAIVLGFGLAVAGILYLPGFYDDRLLSQAESYLAQSYGSLAAEVVDSARWRLAATPRGCRALLTSYEMSHQFDRFRWAIEACARSKVESYEIYRSVAKLQTLDGQDLAALRTLQAAEKFNRAENVVRMIPLLTRLRRNDELIAVATRGASQYPNDSQVLVTSLSVLADAGRWKDAKLPADRLLQLIKGQNVEPELRKLMAQVYEKLGDQATARMVQDGNPAPFVAAEKK